jgi:pimeloyl-ACP methyl ester carboxylesterase
MVKAPAEIAHRSIDVNGIRLHVAEAGPEDGPLVLLLHGFPEFWYGWKAQIDALAAQGYRVVAPDQRGYNLSDKPEPLKAYAVHELARDAAALITALDREQAYIVGHDWGGIVAWWTAMLYPEKVRKLAVLNIPHPKVMARSLKRNRKQQRRSWYIFAFQVPRLPELAMSAFGYRALKETMLRSSRPGTFTQADLARYVEAWSQPSALRGMINWYRALFQAKPKNFPKGQLKMPVRMLWGTRDAFLLETMAQASLKFCEQGELIRLEGATHWLHHEEPARVSSLLIEFLR